MSSTSSSPTPSPPPTSSSPSRPPTPPADPSPSSQPQPPPPPPPQPSTPSSHLLFPVSYTVSSLLRRLHQANPSSPSPNQPPSHSMDNSNASGVYTPPNRTASPFQPPPLYPLTLKGYKASTPPSARLLSRALAEEIRLLVPPRLQLVEDWKLIYSLEQDGVSLATLYKRCEEYWGRRTGFVLVVRDGDGGTFGAYLTDPPQPRPHYYGTGECFLWRASILASTPLLSSLPPPPSSDTTNMQRSTTIGSYNNANSRPHSHTTAGTSTINDTTKANVNTTASSSTLSPPSSTAASSAATSISRASTPERIRFKAFPYSGVNDYMIFCEHGFLSVGGGEGHYGLWLDSVLEKGISSPCPTFGNEALSDEGAKFDILGVEIWAVDAS
ncbi:MAG: hypothetical protein M1819_000570 [Sarea resinae]|nr:MAG: hypothetical protein M1819_000570 [Sarea resinae]